MQQEARKRGIVVPQPFAKTAVGAAAAAKAASITGRANKLSLSGTTGTTDPLIDLESEPFVNHDTTQSKQRRYSRLTNIAAINRKTHPLCTLVLRISLVIIVLTITVLGALLYQAKLRQDAEIARAFKYAVDHGFIHENIPLESIPVLIPVCDRPEYLQQVLEAFDAALGVEDLVIVFSDDCRNQVILDMVNNIKRPKKVILMHHERPYLGIPSIKDNEYATSANVNFLLRFAFDTLQAPAVITLESDVVPSIDFYEYFNWCYNKIAMNPTYNESLFTINGFNMASRSDSDPRNLMEDKFMVWGWMMTRARWSLVKKEFTWLGNWDHQMQHMRETHNLWSLTPMLSRTKHIGMKGINFKVFDPNNASKWARVYIEQEKSSINYDVEEPILSCCSKVSEE